MREFSKYVGLDTHKETIAVAISDALGGKPRYFGETANTPEAVRKMVKDLSQLRRHFFIIGVFFTVKIN